MDLFRRLFSQTNNKPAATADNTPAQKPAVESAGNIIAKLLAEGASINLPNHVIEPLQIIKSIIDPEPSEMHNRIIYLNIISSKEVLAVLPEAIELAKQISRKPGVDEKAAIEDRVRQMFTPDIQNIPNYIISLYAGSGTIDAAITGMNNIKGARLSLAAKKIIDLASGISDETFKQLMSAVDEKISTPGES